MVPDQNSYAIVEIFFAQSDNQRQKSALLLRKKRFTAQDTWSKKGHLTSGKCSKFHFVVGHKCTKYASRSYLERKEAVKTHFK